MAEFERVCVICGKAFKAKQRNHKTCSKECSRESHLRRVRANNKLLRSTGEGGRWKRVKPKLPPREALNEDLRICRELGVSYGEYSAARRTGMIFLKGGRRLVYERDTDKFRIE